MFYPPHTQLSASDCPSSNRQWFQVESLGFNALQNWTPFIISKIGTWSCTLCTVVPSVHVMGVYWRSECSGRTSNWPFVVCELSTFNFEFDRWIGLILFFIYFIIFIFIFRLCPLHRLFRSISWQRWSLECCLDGLPWQQAQTTSLRVLQIRSALANSAWRVTANQPDLCKPSHCFRVSHITRKDQFVTGKWAGIARIHRSMHLWPALQPKSAVS